MCTTTVQFKIKKISGSEGEKILACSRLRASGCFLVLRKLLLVSFCVVVWVFFSVFSIFCITSLVCATPRNHRDSGEKSFSKKKCEKRARAGERQPFSPPPLPPFPSRASRIFALLLLKRLHFTI